MQQFDYSRGKNASDMAMVVDAMALLYNDHPDAFGIVSSDADFTPLVMHLRDKGAAGLRVRRRARRPSRSRSACTKFLLPRPAGRAGRGGRRAVAERRRVRGAPSGH